MIVLFGVYNYTDEEKQINLDKKCSSRKLRARKNASAKHLRKNSIFE